MTSEEIRERNEGKWIGENKALWEIAYQLAVMNERNDVPKLKHNPFGEALGSTVDAGSETEVRGDCGEQLRTMLANTLRPILTRASVHAGFSDWLASAIEQEFILTERVSNERTTPPNPQTSSIQTKEG